MQMLIWLNLFLKQQISKQEYDDLMQLLKLKALKN